MTNLIDRSHPTAPGTDRAIAALIFTTLYLIYLLTFNGAFRTIDELALYAMTESLTQRGSTQTPQILFESYHNPVGELEPGQALAAVPFYALAQRFATVNNLQAIMLLDPLATALTAAMLYLIGRQLTYSSQACVALALAFGLATIAWPYARTFLREPLLGLLFTLALYAYIRWQHSDSTRWIAVMLFVLITATVVKFISAAVAPFFLLPFVGDWIRRHPQQRGRFILFVIIGVALIMISGILIAQSRYGVAGQAILNYLSNFTVTGVLTTIYGLLLSPGKGIVFYMPLVIIAWLSIVHAQRHRRLFIWISVLTPLSMILAYGNNPNWFGGQVWGPRFVVPVVAVMVLPVIDRLNRRSTWLVIVLSLILQIGPVTANWALGHRALNRIHRPWETTIGLDPAYWYLSPPFNQLRFWSIDRADLLWMHPMAEAPFVFDPLLPIGLLSLIGLSIILLARAVRQRSHRREVWLWPAIVLIATALLLHRGGHDAPDAPGFSIDEARAVATPLAVSNTTPHILVTVSNAFSNYIMLGLMKGDFQHFWYSPVQHNNFIELTAAADRARRLTLTIDRVHLPPDQSGNDLRDWLNRTAYQYTGGFVGGYERFGYVWGPDPAEQHPLAVTFGDAIALNSAGIGGDSFVVGDVIPMQLDLSKRGVLPDLVVVATQLVGDTGLIIGGHNTAIQSGALNIAAWPLGATVIDRRGFPIPPDIPAGNYRLEISFEIPDGNLITSDGKRFVAIGQVQIHH